MDKGLQDIYRDTVNGMKINGRISSSSDAFELGSL